MENSSRNLMILIVVILVFVIIIASLSGGKKEKTKELIENMLDIEYVKDGNEQQLKYDTENPVVAMHIKEYGSIVIELYPDVAPNTVNNFISLTKSGFYDENTFHRLVPGFVLQGGDPDGQGTGGPGYSIKGEFTSNGFENNLSHEKWVVSMARSQDPNSAGSQFFICIDNATSLDGDYATFGKVIDGFENIEAIIKREKVADSYSGKLAYNVVIGKAVVDTKGKDYPEPEKIED